MIFKNENDALNKKFENSEFYISLNGRWKFYYVDSYNQFPENITDSAVTSADWKDIKAPGNWEIQGFGTVIYINQPYEFVERDTIRVIRKSNLRIYGRKHLLVYIAEKLIFSKTGVIGRFF